MSFAEQINKFIQKVELKTTNVFRGSCKQVSIDIAEGSPVSTGALLGSWAASKGSSGSYKFSGGQSAWKRVGAISYKDESIASQNKASAMANLMPRIASTTDSLLKTESYYFSNDTSYIKQAEHEGWSVPGGAYHMRENAILNWQTIVINEAIKA